MKNKGFLVIIVIVVALALMSVVAYNGLISSSEGVENSWAGVQTQLQRRGDLIPNLVETVKGYAAHETEIFKAVSDARSKLIGAGSVEQTAQANDQLSGALSRLLAISEAYPDLKANTNFIQLQDELAGTENRIQRSREEYNNAVNDYNKKIRYFPGMLYAKMFGFEKKPYFEAEQAKTEVPNVKF